MAFRRPATTLPRPTPQALTSQMAGIGMRFAAVPAEHPDIENTLTFASEAGMLDGDLRVLSMLVSWLGTHHTYVNVDRLTRLVERNPAERVLAFWSSVASWLDKDRRFRRLRSAHCGNVIDLLAVGTDFQIDRHGEDQRFSGTALRVPAGVLRDRRSDVLAPETLARQHSGYYHRVLIGPSWKADVWTELTAEPALSASEAARRVGCSFATAWHAKRDFEIIRRAKAGPQFQ